MSQSDASAAGAPALSQPAAMLPLAHTAAASPVLSAPPPLPPACVSPLVADVLTRTCARFDRMHAKLDESEGGSLLEQIQGRSLASAASLLPALAARCLACLSLSSLSLSALAI